MPPLFIAQSTRPPREASICPRSGQCYVTSSSVYQVCCTVLLRRHRYLRKSAPERTTSGHCLTLTSLCVRADSKNASRASEYLIDSIWIVVRLPVARGARPETAVRHPLSSHRVARRRRRRRRRLRHGLPCRRRYGTQTRVRAVLGCRRAACARGAAGGGCVRARRPRRGRARACRIEVY